MSKALDKLILMHKRNNQGLRQVRRYSSGEDKEISKAVMELETAFNELAQELKVSPNEPAAIIEALGDDEPLADVLTLPPKEYESLEKDLQKGNQEEVSSYRYRILPRIYSNVKGIECSPRLARKLISYYLRNRRKEKMYRLYGRRKLYSGRVIADHLVHEMYMELGRTMYFSLIGRIKDYIKNKLKNISVLRKMYEAARTIIDYGRRIIERLIEKDIEKYLVLLLGGKAGATVHMLLWHFGVYDSIFALKGYVSAGAVAYLIALAFLVLVIGGALAAYLLIYPIVKEARIMLRPKRLLTFVKGYKLLIGFTEAYSKLLGDISINDLIGILATFAKYSKDRKDNDNAEVIEIIKTIVDKINSNSKYANFFIVNQAQIEKLENAYKEGKKLMVRFEAKVAQGIADRLRENFDVPAFITTDYLDPSTKIEKIENPESAKSASGVEVDRGTLPIELVLLAILTSPSITLTLSADDTKTSIIFKAWDFVRANSNVKANDVFQFLDIYMVAFAKSGYSLSGYLRRKFEERVSEEEQD